MTRNAQDLVTEWVANDVPVEREVRQLIHVNRAAGLDPASAVEHLVTSVLFVDDGPQYTMLTTTHGTGNHLHRDTLKWTRDTVDRTEFRLIDWAQLVDYMGEK